MLWHEDWEIATHDSDRVVFADDMEKGSFVHKTTTPLPPVQRGEQPPDKGIGGGGGYSWKVLVVDDNQDVQTITQSVLRHFVFEGKPLNLIFAASGGEAQRLAAQHPDLALILMDVVMENDHAGLDAVRYIRETLGNRFARIVLRTGQPGFAPEERVIAEYDINDYREKADLSVRQLRSLVMTNLRNYRDLRTIEQLAHTNQSLDALVRERTEVLERQNRELFNSREDMIRAQSIGQMGSWVWQVGSDTLTCSQEARRLLGLDGEESLPLQRMVDKVSPGQRDKVRRTLMQLVASGQDGFSLEHTVVQSGLWVRQQGVVVRHPSGRVLRVEGTILNISQWRS